MANMRALAHGTEMPVLICTGFVEGGDPARFANALMNYFKLGFREDFRKSVTGANQPATSGTCT